MKMVSYDLYSTPNLKSFNCSPYFQINTKRWVFIKKFEKKCIDSSDLLILSDHL